MNLAFKHFKENTTTIESQVEEVTEIIQENKRLKAFINKFIYFVGGFGVAVIIPQVTRIWIGGDIEGVSLTTWGGFFIASIFWLLYGIVHKEKPIIYTNASVCVLDFLIILGIVIDRF